jgi:DNA polymerase delta subunit 1
LGRIKGVKAVMKDTTFQSSAYGKRENVETTINGRVIFDVLPYMYRNHKLSSYSLNSVSAEFLGQQKEDVHHSIISDLQMGSDADRRRLAVYCLKDAYLPQQLMNKLSIMVNYIEMARVTGVPVNFLLTRGQQIKVFSMLLRKTKKENLLIPNIAKHGGDDGVGYEGATVIEPKKAYYEMPIATLDFASLYPSIMQVYIYIPQTHSNAVTNPPSQSSPISFPVFDSLLRRRTTSATPPSSARETSRNSPRDPTRSRPPATYS